MDSPTSLPTLNAAGLSSVEPPAVSTKSFVMKGTPCSGLRGSPHITARSAASAYPVASPTKVTIALILEFTASIRSTWARSTSTGESSFSRIRRANSVASA